jgi:cytochrome c2
MRVSWSLERGKVHLRPLAGKLGKATLVVVDLASVAGVAFGVGFRKRCLWAVEWGGVYARSLVKEWRTAALVAACVLPVAFVAGMRVQRENVPDWAIAKATGLYHKFFPVRATATQWQDVNTNLHVVQVAVTKVSNVVSTGGSLAEVAGNLLIASPQGHFSYLDTRNELHALDLHVPTNMEALRKDRVYNDPMFNATLVRTHGLLAIRTGDGAYDLYATYSRFMNHCFDFVVGRVSIEANDKLVRPTGEWHDVWAAKPCVRFKDRGSLFVGLQAGGRMARLSDDTILVSVGDHNFDGFNDSQAVSMDPKSDLGRLVAVNIKTGASRHYAIGLRNPEGLAIAPDGRIWETEHGPQGGDEINLMQEGRNYGWPIVTYGMTYGYPPRNWPFNPKPGGHEGYTRPRLAFVPSIGIGQLAVPDAREFPNWAGSLLLCSLRANTLYHLKTEGDDIVYAEPISLGYYRLRDIVSMPDGRLAILGDYGWLLLVRNAELHRGEPQQLQVSGLSAVPRPAPEEAPRQENPAERGRRYFLGACSTCHSVEGEVRVGPPLNGIVGRRVASAPGFGYSSALRQRGGVWTADAVGAFIINPKGALPGTAMPETGIDVLQMSDIVAYLQTLH